MPGPSSGRQDKAARLAAALKEVAHSFRAVYPDTGRAILTVSRPDPDHDLNLPVVGLAAGVPGPEGEAPACRRGRLAAVPPPCPGQGSGIRRREWPAAYESWRSPRSSWPRRACGPTHRRRGRMGGVHALRPAPILPQEDQVYPPRWPPRLSADAARGLRGHRPRVPAYRSWAIGPARTAADLGRVDAA
jgi:hypothetical protein